MNLWHVPTTLLAGADSAHGGKTALNLGTAKNQIGTFWVAERVVLAESFLAELPLKLRAEGLTELLKALWLGAPGSLSRVDRADVGELAFAPWHAVAHDLGLLLDAAVAVKHEIVARDPREELGIRTWLNLGHTAAHGLELLCGASHGVAVAWGLAAAAHLSLNVGFDRSARDRLWSHVAPLMGDRSLRVDRASFCDVLARDKKTVDGVLRSVLLRAPGEPVVVRDITADNWFSALEVARRDVFEAPVRIAMSEARRVDLRMSASKSEMNRALVIAALRKGETIVEGESEAEDVLATRAGITSLQRGAIADAKNGGTTFRFLTAVAASQPDGGRIRIGEQLAGRPHDALLSALRLAGVEISNTDRLYTFSALPAGDLSVRVDAERSSQFASAIALLAASGRRVRLDLGTTGVSSQGYFEMTLNMLEQAGVIHVQKSPGVLELSTERPEERVTLRASADASSGALWHVFNRLGGRVTLASTPDDRQPDRVVESLLWDLTESGSHRIDVGGTPDLVPVMAAYAALSEAAVTLVGAPHLRHKESDRIVDLVAAFSEVGVHLEPLSHGIRVPAGVQRPTEGAVFDPRADHRLAFAALLLCTAAPLTLRNPRCVAKSYPGVFADARQAGFAIALSDTSCQSPDT